MLTVTVTELQSSTMFSEETFPAVKRFFIERHHRG